MNTEQIKKQKNETVSRFIEDNKQSCNELVNKLDFILKNPFFFFLV